MKLKEQVVNKLEGKVICPRCRENVLDKVEVRNSLSRRDNETYICSPCGTAEAMEDFVR